jgi:rhodanese-related sulfurtransferase
VGEGEARIDSITVEEAWARLEREADSILIDVRTAAEWAFVGVPELSSIGKRPVLVQWQQFPDNRLNTAFVERVTEALVAIGASKDSELLFICRSGSRSLKAARAMASAGHTRCCNVAEGFEGPLDADSHRGRLSGWKAKGLPWAQN